MKLIRKLGGSISLPVIPAGETVPKKILRRWNEWDTYDDKEEPMIAKYPSRDVFRETYEDTGWGPQMTNSQILKEAAMKGNDLKEGILAAVKITNTNLINLHNRLQNKRTQRMILQTEALSIFKGNIIRVLKVVFDASDISRIKSCAMFHVSIDTIHPVVDRIALTWVDRGFGNENFKRSLKDLISNEFAKITAADLNEQAMAAMKEIQIIEKPTEVKSPNDVNFDSIKQIKFKVR